MGKERNVELDLLRILACFMVIMIHFASLFLSNTANVSQWKTLNFYDSLSRSSVPLFFMISGVFFLDNNKQITFKKILNHAIRLLTAMLFWETLFSIKRYGISGSFMQNVINIIPKLVTAYSHFWYIPVLVGIYFLVPVLRCITQNEIITKYYLIIWVIFSIAKNTITILSQVVLKNHVYANTIINSFLNTFFNVELTSYVGYFILGYYLFYHFHKKINLITLLITTFISQLACAAINYFGTYSIFEGKSWNGMQNYMTITTFIEAVCIFLIFKDYVAGISFNNKYRKLITEVSSYTFGIYLMHPFFTESLYAQLVSMNVAITLPILSVVVFITCAVITLIIKKIPLANKYLV